MPDLEFVLVDEATFDDIPAPARPGARCQTCDYWERIDGSRDAPAADAPDAISRASLKRSRLLASRDVAGSYGMLAYRGQLDSSRPGNGKPLTGSDLRAALDALLDGRPISAEQVPSIGCSIKWKAA